MRKLTSLFTLMVVAVMAFGLAACGSKGDQTTKSSTGASETASTGSAQPASGTEAAGGKKDIVIGLSFGYSMVPYTIAQKMGAETAAKELGVKLITTTANTNLTQQVTDIENLVQQGINALCFMPIDSKGVAPVTEEIRKNGIGAFSFDIGVNGTDVDGHVASDNYQIGVMSAKKMGELTNGKGNIAIVGWSTVEATVQREQGFKDTISKEFPGIKIVAYQDGGMNKEKGLAATENILQAHPDITAIYASNEQAALGAINGLQSSDNNVFVVGVDSDVESLQTLISNPKYKALVSQDPYEMAYQSVKQAVAWVKKEPYDKQKSTPISLVTTDNVKPFLEKEQKYQDIFKSGK